MRRDLGMRRGKEVAQGAHASLSFLTKKLDIIGARTSGNYVVENSDITEAEKHWLENSFAKICVRVESEQELLDIHAKAIALGLESHLITDSGRTEFHGVPTITCLAIGPDWCDKIDEVTKQLKLL